LAHAARAAHAPPEGGDEPCGLDCWDPPDDDDDPFNPPGFMSVQSWQTTSTGMAVAVYQPASAGCDEEEPSIEQQLEDLLEANPFALLDIPCDQIPFWQDVINFEVPVSVTDRLQNEELFGPGEIQTIQEASGRKVNLDLFEVAIDESDLPTGLSPEAVLDQIRLNFNDYAEGADFQFYPGTVDEDIKWMTDPLGTVFTINLNPDGIFPANGSVVTTDYSQTSWTFSTVWTSDDGYHPVSGNRRFGYHQDGQEIKFFSRGVDRTSIPLYSIANTVGGGFNKADSVWESFQDNVRNFLGDSAEIKAPVTWRPRYSDIQDILNGDMDISELDQCSGIWAIILSKHSSSWSLPYRSLMS